MLSSLEGAIVNNNINNNSSLLFGIRFKRGILILGKNIKYLYLKSFPEYRWY
jgi:hypothetical protein